MSIDEILNAIQGRKGTAKFNQATDALWKLAERADEKNRPERGSLNKRKPASTVGTINAGSSFHTLQTQAARQSGSKNGHTHD